MITLASRAFILPIVLTVAAASGQATFQGLGFLTGNQFGHTSEALGVSGDGKAVVGYSTSTYAKEPFRWTAGGMTGLGFASIGRAVSADGKVVVGDDQSNGFSWTDPKNGGQGKVNIADLPGGGCSMTVRIGNTLEMVPWIRSWGPEVEVLAPKGLLRVDKP